ncbi:hypothetical protein [Tenacibaculum singaporense]|uniref:hypothetical protein n=1 Tax=Tenacibaculum singaporense TaxID=2358479 RepID=UPI000F6915BE|nr:hypothetical protein [Tenacibaculum singaporense]RSC92256.1 hypothetical protein EI424_14565 [Tenacibaculum singaporense]
MIKQLITDFFNAIEKNEYKTNKNAKAVFWANELQEVGYNDENYISERKAKRYYEKYVEEKEGVSVSLPNSYQRDFMANYLNYEDYEDYVNKHTSSSKKSSKKNNTFDDNVGDTSSKGKAKKQKSIIVVGIIIIVPFLFIYRESFLDSGNCFVWKKDHYKKTSCSTENSINNNVFSININSFKKVTLTNDMEFFTDGKPNFWYGSNIEGKREFFTARGVHPETLKELDPITPYILEKEGFSIESKNAVNN